MVRSDAIGTSSPKSFNYFHDSVAVRSSIVLRKTFRQIIIILILVLLLVIGANYGILIEIELHFTEVTISMLVGNLCKNASCLVYLVVALGIVFRTHCYLDLDLWTCFALAR